MANVLIVLTSHTSLGATGKRTGFYFDELATPYWALVDAGHDVHIASIQGGGPQHDPSSVREAVADRPETVERFLNDKAAMLKLSNTPAIATVDPSLYDAIFLPGGHGVMYDFPDNAALAAAVGQIFDAGGVVSAVCHGPAGLLKAKRANGQPIVAGLKVNSFTDAEEEAVGLTSVMPLLLETELRKLGGKFEGTANFKGYSVRDGQLITGQNPASAELVATEILTALNEIEKTKAA